MSTRTSDLAEVIEGLGVEVHKTHGDEINGRCPVHYKYKGRESGRFSWYMNTDSGLWHCFTCGARGNLSMLVSELTDDPQALWQVQSHIITQGLRRLTQDESEYDRDVDPDVDWATYAKFKDLPNSILEYRQFDPDVANKFGVKWDPENKATVVPIVSPLGELKGWQLKQGKWVRNRPEGVHKEDTLFGIERAYGETAVLVESPLDVVRLHSVYDGIHTNCVSSFGSNVSDKQVKLLRQRFNSVIIAMDNDKAGLNETLRIAPLLQGFRGGTRYWQYHNDDPKDIGEMTDGQIIRGITTASVVHLSRR